MGCHWDYGVPRATTTNCEDDAINRIINAAYVIIDSAIIEFGPYMNRGLMPTEIPAVTLKTIQKSQECNIKKRSGSKIPCRLRAQLEGSVLTHYNHDD